ncbi:MAG: type II toxin-antitoxin system VapC family toxin [Proteobacteria bacterium]|nr:type II toxin-antitoxin system VapC family toxin [Pseudomonadota bacterium]
MNGKFILDTNIVIALFANDIAVQQRLGATEHVFIPSIVLGELYYGAYKSINIKENISKINEFAQANSILVCDMKTASHYGRIKNDIRIKGCPIPENDIWIAALGSQYQFTVVSRDEHFEEIESITIEKW